MPVLEVSKLTLNCFHSAFPVTDPVPEEEEGKHFGRLRGVVYSRDIATKFFERFFDGHDETRTRETWERYIAAYPRWFKPHEVRETKQLIYYILHTTLTTVFSIRTSCTSRSFQTWRHDPDVAIQRDNVMRLDDIMDLDVHTVPIDCSLKHLFDTFINERLRHLIVVDHENKVHGIVTRKDLAGLCGAAGHEDTPWWKRGFARPVIKAKNWFYPSAGSYKWGDHHENAKQFVPVEEEE